MTRKIDHKRLGQLREGQGEIANHIIDEFAAGRLSRRDFIRRGTVVGISVPLLGSILAACGSSGSSSSPSGGSSSAAGAARRGDQGGHRHAHRGHQPGHRGRPGRPGHARADRRVPVPVHPDADLEAGAGHQLDAEQQGRRVDVQDPPGGQVPQRPGADRRRRGVHLPAAHQPQGRGERAVRLRRRADPGRGEEGRRLHGGVPPQRPERELPVPDLLRQLQHDHLAEGLRPGQVGEHVPRHRAVQARLVHAEVRGHVHAQRKLLGQEGAALVRPSSPSTTPRTRRSWP